MEMTINHQPLSNVLDEAERLIELTGRHDLIARLLGGTAIQLLTRGTPDALFVRTPQDIDIMSTRSAGGELAELLAGTGYRADDGFNALNGHRRLLFFDDVHGRQVDVFLDRFAMCHEIPIAARLDLVDRTLPLAELLLMKLQIVELNQKDQEDIFHLLLYRACGTHDDGVINKDHIGLVCARDWGLWRTVKLNLQRSEAGVETDAVPATVRMPLRRRLAELDAAVDAAPKTRRWRLRARVGEKVRWYEEPEEVS